MIGCDAQGEDERARMAAQGVSRGSRCQQDEGRDVSRLDGRWGWRRGGRRSG